MKPTFSILALLCMSLLAVAQPKKATVPVSKPTADPTKKAFIVAIANYPKGGGWDAQNPLSSQNDLALLKEILKKQGFDAQNIIVVTEQNATKQGVLKAFAAFKERIAVGDKIIVHFSGHGQQVFDVSGDEPDQLDEALVLYDSPSSPKDDQNYKGEKHLLDDELNAMLYDLRAKVGAQGHVVVFLDACHSGTASRGQGKMRGGMAPIAPKNQPLGQGKESSSNSGMVEPAPKTAPSTGLGKLIAFGGTASSQPNFEINDTKTQKGYGSLTYGASKAFAHLKANTTYRQFFAEIVNTVTTSLPYQTPMAEGDIDQVFFGGAVVEQTPYLNIVSMDADLVTLDAGTIQNLQPQAKIAIYPAGIADPAQSKALYTGTVATATALTAEVKLTQPLPYGTEKNSLWAFVTEYSYQHLGLKVRMKEIPEAQQTALKNTTTMLPHLQWVADAQNADLILSQTAEGQLLLSDPHTLLSFGGAFASTKLKERLETYTKVKILKGFTGQDDDLRVNVQINDNANGGRCAYQPNQSGINGVPSVQVGQNVCVCAKNFSDKNLYITILEFWPDGTFQQIYPRNNSLEDPLKPDLERNYGGKVTLSPTEPYGQHIVKVFATVGKQLDFGGLEKAQFRGNKGQIHPLEDFMYRSRGIGELENDDNNKVYTQTLIYQLLPAQ